MRKAALIGTVAALLGLLAAAAADTSNGEALREATNRTARVSSQRFVLTARLTQSAKPTVLHVHGKQAGASLISVHMQLGEGVKLANGTRLPGPTADTLLDGPFLYLRSPATASILNSGDLWLRKSVAALAASSPELRSLRAVTPSPLLRILNEARRPVALQNGALFHATVAYDDAIVRTALRDLTGGLEFRGLRLAAGVGRDGLVHSVRLTGRTADGTGSLLLTAKLYAFGKPVHVTPPTKFVDQQLTKLAE